VHCFVTHVIYLENTGALSYVALSNMDISLYKIKSLTHISSEKSSLGAVLLMVVGTNFPGSCVLLESSNHIYKYCQWFPQKSHFVHFTEDIFCQFCF
jgi:hypothetical protein